MIVLSWMLIISGILNELVLPYDSIINAHAEVQSNKILLSLNKLYWYFVPAAFTGFAGGLLVHKYKKENAG